MLIPAPQPEFVAKAACWRPLLARLARLARLTIGILILGETGVGKELLARWIHFASRRAEGPFIAVNCGAFPDTLLDSFLFGHRRGAFTNAISNRTGAFEMADGGTIFLDEIGEMPLDVQVKLLRAIQEQEVLPLGASVTVPIDVRIICATHKNIEAMVADGTFRADLYYRLVGHTETIPPLRDRPEDIGPIARRIVEAVAKEMREGEEFPEDELPWLSEEAIDALEAHCWPGNVRELEQVLRSLSVTSFGEVTGAMVRRRLGIEQPPAGVWLGRKETAGLLNVSERTVSRWADHGKIRAQGSGSGRRFWVGAEFLDGTPEGTPQG